MGKKRNKKLLKKAFNAIVSYCYWNKTTVIDGPYKDLYEIKIEIKKINKILDVKDLKIL